eukprot:765465-Pelagomonas_calceolata.AAC.4
MLNKKKFEVGSSNWQCSSRGSTVERVLLWAHLSNAWAVRVGKCSALSQLSLFWLLSGRLDVAAKSGGDAALKWQTRCRCCHYAFPVFAHHALVSSKPFTTTPLHRPAQPHQAHRHASVYGP